MQNSEELYRQYSETVYRYLLSLTRDGSLAEELTQETFYRAVKNANRFDGSCKPTTWLCAIAKNALAEYRRKNPPPEELTELSGLTQPPEDEVLSKSGQTDILRKIQALPPGTRDILYLRLLGGLSFAQIGEVLSITENRARVTFYRGKEKLKKELTDNE